ncbi:hypothetical protein Vadar_026169 [Vaccinium darrowii]|uniref:Uncharacterized protein n=1 Tax=Vaccinium darrowii TaxID=229202 RepID=A0ACB7X3V7_9ERIC|nr:hypothetical protein Vadar_026169 [Vaccinium darrowii]
MTIAAADSSASSSNSVALPSSLAFLKLAAAGSPFGVPMFSQYDEANQSVNTQQVFFPQQQYAQNGFLATPGIMNGFNVSQSPRVMNGMSMSPMNVSSGPILQNVQSGSVPRYASSTVGNTMAVSQGMNPSQTQYTIPQAHITGAYNMLYMIPCNFVGNVVSQRTATPENSGGMPQPPWYIDSGTTHHITNNLQNLNIAQPAANGEGIMVGNGNNVPITHTGQEFSSTLVQGPMSQGTLSHSELL